MNGIAHNWSKVIEIDSFEAFPDIFHRRTWETFRTPTMTQRDIRLLESGLLDQLRKLPMVKAVDVQDASRKVLGRQAVVALSVTLET
jgi:hypothetical protein